MDGYGHRQAVDAEQPFSNQLARPGRPNDARVHRSTAETTAPLLGETIGRLGSLIARFSEVAQRTRNAKDQMFGSTPSPSGVSGGAAKDMPVSEVIRNQLGALEHLAMLLEEDTQLLINQLV